MFLFFPHFISTSPRANTILYSCYLCKQCALFLFLHSVNPAVSNWDAAAGADRAQSILDSVAFFFRCNSRLCLTEEAFFGLFWDRQQSCCMAQIEKGRKSNAWMIERERVNFQRKTCWASFGWWFTGVLFYCVDDNEENIVKTIKTLHECCKVMHKYW